jgi:hypothetical protein
MKGGWTAWAARIGIVVVLIATFGVLGLPVASGAGKQRVNAARRLLEKIKLVDGEGSGLDADTVRGKTMDNVATFHVVDSSGREVGVFTEVSGHGCNVLRREGGTVIGLAVSPGGVNGCGGDGFHHETANCSGTRYRVRESLILPLYVPDDPTTGDVGRIGYYAGEPIQSHTFVAIETANGPFPCPPGSTPSVSGFCCSPNYDPFPRDAGPALAFDLSPFSAPFKIE